MSRERFRGPRRHSLSMRLALRLARLVLSAAVGAYALGSAVSLLGAHHWAAELLTHFRVQAAAAGALLALAALGLRAWRVGAAAGVLAALHLLPVLPYLVPGDPPDAAEGPRLRLLQVNVHTTNRRHQAVVDLVVETRPDVIAFLEVDPIWLGALSGLHARYPHRVAQPRSDNFGIALFSRFPIDDLRVRPLGHASLPMVEGRFTLGTSRITLAVAHPVPPAGPVYAGLRNRQLDALARRLGEAPSDEVVLLGDLNTSPWSPFHRRLERAAGLRNAARGLGIFPTWPVGSDGLSPLRIPLDHCLASPGIRVLSIETGPEIGSDHLPVLVEIAATGRTAI